MTASETIAAIGERVAAAAMTDRTLLAALGVTEAEERLIRIDPGYERASTASRLDAFLLPDSLHFAEYNAESPAGPAYTQRLCELFDDLPSWRRSSAGWPVTYHRDDPAAARGAARELSRMGRPRLAAGDRDRRLARGPDLDRVRAAARRVHRRAACPTVICDPRDLSFDGGVLRAAGQPIDLVYRRVLINDIIARPDECGALLTAYEQRAVCVANTLRCKLAHKKAFFAVLTDPAHAGLHELPSRRSFSAHVPWTRLVADVETERGGRSEGLLELARRDREQLVLKPNDEYGGTGVHARLGNHRVRPGTLRSTRRWRPTRDLGRSGANPRAPRGLPPLRRCRPRRRCGTCWWISRPICFAASSAAT